MLAAVFRGPGRVALEERPRPELAEEDILVRIHAAAICGTDLKIYRGGHVFVGEGDTVVLGHELAGEIVTMGSRASGWQVGQRVSVVPNVGCGHCDVCVRGRNNMCPSYTAFGIHMDGGFQQYMHVPRHAIQAGNLIKLPDGLSYQTGALIEPLACCFNAWRGLEVTPEDRVLILGTGPIAGIFLQLATAYGARQAIVVGRRDIRLEQMRKLGATHTINNATADTVAEIMRITGGEGVDVALTCAPAPELQAQAVEVLARFGRMNFFAGLTRGTKTQIDTNKVHYSGLTLTGSTGTSIEDYVRALRLVESGKINLMEVVTDRFPMDLSVDAIEHALSGNGLKVLILPQEQSSA